MHVAEERRSRTVEHFAGGTQLQYGVCGKEAMVATVVAAAAAAAAAATTAATVAATATTATAAAAAAAAAATATAVTAVAVGTDRWHHVGFTFALMFDVYTMVKIH